MTLAAVVPVEHRHWHPVALSTAVADAPVAVQLLDQPLVLWRDVAGTVQAWTDRCPHRGAALSLGCIRHGAEGSQLECPYHGWQFNPGGQVVAIPALPGFAPPAAHRATVHACTERHGLVWVRLAADGEIRRSRAGEAIIDSRYWHCMLEGKEVTIPCGGTHVATLAELGQVRVQLAPCEEGFTLTTRVTP